MCFFFFKVRPCVLRCDTSRLIAPSKFLITRERAKPRFRAKIGDFRANRAVSRQDGWAGLTHEEMAFVFLGVLRLCQSRPAAARRQSRGVRSRAASPCTMSVSSCARRQSRRAEWPRREESRVVASCVIASRVVSSNCIDAAFRTIACFSFF